MAKVIPRRVTARIEGLSHRAARFAVNLKLPRRSRSAFGVCAMALGSLTLLQACATAPSSGATVGAVPSDSLWVREELYFGALIPTGGEVTDAMWEGFVDAEVTPRFPEGLTQLNSMGRYQYRSGEIKREATRILILYYRPSAENEARVLELMAAYKTAYAQESVLRVTTQSTVRFYD